MPSPTVPLHALAGPDAGWTVRLVPGYHWLGRRACAPSIGVPVDDRTLEPHHAILDVADDGSIALLQTSGRTPIRVDGRPVRSSWTIVPNPSRIVIGATLLSVGQNGSIRRGESTAGGGRRSVLAPIRDDHVELDRFARDLAAVAVVCDDAVRLATPTDVVLGVGERRRPIDLHDAAGAPVLPGALAHIAQAIHDRATVTTGPVVTTLHDEACVAVAAADADRVVASILGQLDDVERARVLVVGADELADFGVPPGIGRPVLVRLSDGDPPPACTSLLEVGDTWRATWWPELLDGATATRGTSLHAAGVSPRRLRWGRRPADTRRPFVGEQVAGPDPELGRRVVGVPQSARRQREASAPDAVVELVPQPGEQCELFVEPRSPR